MKKSNLANKKPEAEESITTTILSGQSRIIELLEAILKSLTKDDSWVKPKQS